MRVGPAILAASGAILQPTITPPGMPSAVASAACKDGVTAMKKCTDFATASKLLSELRSSDLADVFAYATAISVYGKCGRWEEAVALLDSMEADGLIPDRPCFNSALAACARSGRPAEATELLERMVCASLPPLAASYAAAGRAALQADDPIGAIAVMEKLRCSGVSTHLASLKVELSAHDALLAASGSDPVPLAGDGSAAARDSSHRIAQLTHQTLHVGSDGSSSGLSSSDMTWLWRTYSRAQLHAIRLRLRRDETLSTDADATASLLAALSRSTTTGQMPCFQNEQALAGYTDFHLINRASKVADVLRAREPSWLPAAAASVVRRPVISLGGGPAYDLAALAVLRSFVEMAAAPPPAKDAPTAASAQAIPPPVHVLDYEPRWSVAAASVRTAVQSVLGGQHEMHFGRCDVAEPLASPSNAAVAAALPKARLLIASYVVCENAKALEAGRYALFAEVMAEAKPGTMLLVLETTHRQYPQLVAAARRGVEMGNAARGEECALRVAVPETKGRGGSSCILLKEAGEVSAEETREQVLERAQEDDRLRQTLAHFAVDDARHRRDGRPVQVDWGGPRRRGF